MELCFTLYASNTMSDAIGFFAYINQLFTERTNLLLVQDQRALTEAKQCLQTDGNSSLPVRGSTQFFQPFHKTRECFHLLAAISPQQTLAAEKIKKGRKIFT